MTAPIVTPEIVSLGTLPYPVPYFGYGQEGRRTVMQAVIGHLTDVVMEPTAITGHCLGAQEPDQLPTTPVAGPGSPSVADILTDAWGQYEQTPFFCLRPGLPDDTVLGTLYLASKADMEALNAWNLAEKGWRYPKRVVLASGAWAVTYTTSTDQASRPATHEDTVRLKYPDSLSRGLYVATAFATQYHNP